MTYKQTNLQLPTINKNKSLISIDPSRTNKSRNLSDPEMKLNFSYPKCVCVNNK